MGVDFGPYLQRAAECTRELVPADSGIRSDEERETGARVRHHERWLGARAVDNAGFRRCYGWIGRRMEHHRVGSFSAATAEFKGEFLSLRFRFYYNPDKGEMEQ